MFIIKELLLPNEVSATVHRVDRIEMRDEIIMFLNSYANENSNMILWQQSIVAPSEALTLATDYKESLYKWLVSPNNILTGGTVSIDATPLLIAQSKLKAKVDAQRDTCIAKGCMTTWGRVDTDDASVRNLMVTAQSASFALMNKDETFVSNWRMADNTMAENLTANDVMLLNQTIQQHIQACYERSWTLKAAIEAATDQAELDAIDITADWSDPVTPPTTSA